MVKKKNFNVLFCASDSQQLKKLSLLSHKSHTMLFCFIKTQFLNDYQNSFLFLVIEKLPIISALYLLRCCTIIVFVCKTRNIIGMSFCYHGDITESLRE